MRRLKAAIWGAVCFVVLGFIITAWGLPLIGRQAWWMHTAWLAVSGAVLGLMADLYLQRKTTRHAMRVKLVADQLGLTYHPTVERPLASLPCFEHWVSGEDGFSGEYQGLPVSVFDMTECIPSDEGNCVRSTTTVLLSAAGLPKLLASPKTFSDLFNQAFGLGGMAFDAAAAPFELAGTVRRFGRAIRIEYPGFPGPVTAATTESMAQDTAIRRLLSPGLMAALLDHREMSFQTGNGWLACWTGFKVRSATERAGLIDSAQKLRTALLAAAADPKPIVLPPPSLPAPGQYIARILVTIAGAILGLFATFFGFVPVAKHWAWDLAVPIVTTAGGIVGGITGYGIGALLGRVPIIARWTPPPESTPEERAEKRRQSGWLILFGGGGWFVGLIAGFGCLILVQKLNWVGVLSFVMPVLFFGSGFAGVLCGLAIGVRFVRGASPVNGPSTSGH